MSKKNSVSEVSVNVKAKTAEYRKRMKNAAKDGRPLKDSVEEMGKAADEAQEKIQAFGTEAEIAAAKEAALTEAMEAGEEAGRKLVNSLTNIEQNTNKLALSQQRAEKAANDLVVAKKHVARTAKDVETAEKKAKRAIDQGGKESKEAAEAGRDLSKAHKAHAAASRKAGQAERKLTSELKKVNTEKEKAVRVTKKLEEAEKKRKRATQDSNNSMTSAVAKGNLMARVVEGAANTIKDFARWVRNASRANVQNSAERVRNARMRAAEFGGGVTSSKILSAQSGFDARGFGGDRAIDAIKDVSQEVKQAVVDFERDGQINAKMEGLLRIFGGDINKVQQLNHKNAFEIAEIINKRLRALSEREAASIGDEILSEGKDLFAFLRTEKASLSRITEEGRVIASSLIKNQKEVVRADTIRRTNEGVAADRSIEIATVIHNAEEKAKAAVFTNRVAGGVAESQQKKEELTEAEKREGRRAEAEAKRALRAIAQQKSNQAKARKLENEADKIRERISKRKESMDADRKERTAERKKEGDENFKNRDVLQATIAGSQEALTKLILTGRKEDPTATVDEKILKEQEKQTEDIAKLGTVVSELKALNKTIKKTAKTTGVGA